MGNSVGIVGGGAAGMMAAITAARRGAKVTLIEGNDRLGKKILATGNGKCNLGNEKLGMEAYYTKEPELLKNCLNRFGTAQTIAFFQELGVMVKSKNGYLYPFGGQASIVLDALRFAVRELGVVVVTDCKIGRIDRIDRIEKKRHSGQVYLQGSGKEFCFDGVILACGSQAAPKTGSDGSGYRLAGQLGHGIIPVVPGLVALKCREDYFRSVAGVRAEAILSVYWGGECVAQEQGELQLTEYGISGIPVFQISRIVNYLLKEEAGLAGGKQSGLGQGRGNLLTKGIEVELNLLPDSVLGNLEKIREGRNPEQGQKTVEEFFTGILHKKLMLLFIKLAGLKPSEPVSAADREKIEQVYRLCSHWKVHVIGSGSYENAQVCAGGVPLGEVTEDLESKKVSGIYFAGELLDVDGKCGGYNLQWAWCSGYLAGNAAALRKGKRF